MLWINLLAWALRELVEMSKRSGGGTQFTCFTGTKVQILTQLLAQLSRRSCCNLLFLSYLLYWYKITNTDAATGAALSAKLLELHPHTLRFTTQGTRFTCFTGTKVQILTQLSHIHTHCAARRKCRTTIATCAGSKWTADEGMRP